MAQPGEFFPIQFAQTILQLNEQRQQHQAQLEEMRSQRAAANFLEKERLTLQQQGQALQSAQFGADQAAADEARKARIQIETDRIKKEREGLAIKAFDDFQRYGTAFLPNSSAGEIKQFRDSYNQALGSTESGPGYTLHEFEIPGHGVLLQRVGGPEHQDKLLELQETQAKIEGLRQTRALQLANQKLYEERAETERFKRQNLVGGVTARDAEFARSALETYRKNAANALTQARIDTSPESLKRAAAIGLDWKQAFSQDKATLDRVNNLEAIMDAFVESTRTGKVARQTNTEALQRAGVADTYYEAASQALFAGTGERVAGRVTAPPESVSARDLRQGRAMAGTFLVTESGVRVPVSPAEAERTPLGSKLDPGIDPANFARASQLIQDSLSGKIPRNDPSVIQAFQFLKQYRERVSAAQ
jgi:hypothetical protein